MRRGTVVTMLMNLSSFERMKRKERPRDVSRHQQLRGRGNNHQDAATIRTSICTIRTLPPGRIREKYYKYRVTLAVVSFRVSCESHTFVRFGLAVSRGYVRAFPPKPTPPPPSARQRRTLGQSSPELLPAHFLPIPSKTIHPHELDNNAQNIHPHELTQITHLPELLCSVPHLDPWVVFRATGPQSNHWRFNRDVFHHPNHPLNHVAASRSSGESIRRPHVKGERVLRSSGSYQHE